MGTFHDNLGDLHGITVAVQTTQSLFVGRCHQATDEKVILLDADEHTDPNTADQYLQQAAKWGVFKKHDNLVLPGNQVDWIKPLNTFR